MIQKFSKRLIRKTLTPLLQPKTNKTYSSQNNYQDLHYKQTLDQKNLKNQNDDPSNSIETSEPRQPTPLELLELSHQKQSQDLPTQNSPKNSQQATPLAPLLAKYDLFNRKHWLKRIPNFEKQNLGDIEHATGYSLTWDAHPRKFWTPITQKISPDEEFLEYLDDLSFITDEKWQEENTEELVEAFIQEAQKDTPYTYIKNFYCLPSKNCSQHGNVDFQIYNTSNNYNWPIVAVTIMKPVRASNNDFVLNTHATIPMTIGTWFKILGEVTSKNDENFLSMIKEVGDWDHVRVIQTNGHFWKQFEFSCVEQKMRSTKWYQPKSKNELANEGQTPFSPFSKANSKSKKIWNDLEFVEIALGLVRHSTSWRSRTEEELRDAYEFQNELHLFEKLSEDDKEIVRKRQERWGWQPFKGLRDYVIGYNLDNKKID